MTAKKTLFGQAQEYVKSNNARTIARDTGLNYAWMRKFSDGLIIDPRVSKIEKILLHAQHAGKQVGLKKPKEVLKDVIILGEVDSIIERISRGVAEKLADNS